MARPRVIQNVSRVVAVAAGDDHSCVLCADAGGVEGSEVYLFGATRGANSERAIATSA